MRTCVLLLLVITGVGTVPSSALTVHVSDVNVLRGQEAVLGCSFTHHRYAGNIELSWIGRIKIAPPFFQCQVKNDSSALPVNCFSTEDYALAGDLRQGMASLRIKHDKVSEGKYFCQVTLDGKKTVSKALMLNVQGKRLNSMSGLPVWSYGVRPAILNVSLITGSAPQRLECLAEGKPIPNITWLSASGSPLTTTLEVQTLSTGLFLNSSVPYEQQDELTCRVESELGRAEQTYRPANTKRDVVLVCGTVAAALLLLATGGVIVHRLRLRARNRHAQIRQNLEDRVPHSSHGPAGDADALPTVALPEASEGVPSTTRALTHQEQDLFYSTVTFHKSSSSSSSSSKFIS
ncbi:sialic acid binding Ig-like lectin 15, like isoform X4 [Syngnathus acus]|uniref:sialic acid binding Ig-like lectin 15, like isoform X4 n=1 Tax=Syngnathus acus TaxID=161584 RepID=UPI001885E561|nr:sialic acid binding Ig-like lectin 15, like isoform X4 [Syngnathus acus]